MTIFWEEKFTFLQKVEKLYTKTIIQSFPYKHVPLLDCSRAVISSVVWPFVSGSSRNSSENSTAVTTRYGRNASSVRAAFSGGKDRPTTRLASQFTSTEMDTAAGRGPCSMLWLVQNVFFSSNEKYLVEELS